MKTLLSFSFAALLLAGCSGSNSNNTPATTNSVSTNAANGTQVNYLGALAQAETYSQQKIDAASLNQAIQQFNAAEGRYPKNLQELVPNYLAKVPQAPVGYKINYDPNSGVASVVKQ